MGHKNFQGTLGKPIDSEREIVKKSGYVSNYTLCTDVWCQERKKLHRYCFLLSIIITLVMNLHNAYVEEKNRGHRFTAFCRFVFYCSEKNSY